MTCPHPLRDGTTPTKGGMVGMHPYLMRRHTTRFVPNGDEKTNTKESINDLKEFMDKETNKSSYSVSMEGQLYEGFGCMCLSSGDY